eukprot:569612-Pyramimonas_sp.AAC.1
MERPERLSYKRPYAGRMINTLQSKLTSLHKVKAHVADSPDLTADQRYFKLGNDEAVRAAKRGVDMHAKGSHAELDFVDWQLKVAKNVGLLAARLLPSWPRLNLDGVEFVAPAREVEPPPPPCGAASS